MANGQKFILSFLGKDQGASSAASSVGSALGGLSNAVKKVTQASTSMGGKLNAGVTASQPALAKLRADLDKTAATMRSNAGAFAGGFFGKSGSMKDIRSSLSGANQEVKSLEAGLNKLRNAQLKNAAGSDSLASDYAKASAEVDKLSAKLAQLSAKSGSGSPAVSTASNVTDTFNKLKSASSVLKSLEVRMAELTRKSKDLTLTPKVRDDAAKKLAELSARYTATQEKLKQAAENRVMKEQQLANRQARTVENTVNKQIEQTAAKLEKAAEKAANLRDKLDAAAKEGKDIESAIEAVNPEITNATNNANRLRSALSGAKLADSLGKTIKSLPAGIQNLAKGFLALNDPIRYVSQAVGNFGRQLMFITTIPIAGFLAFAAKTTVGIEAAFAALDRAGSSVEANMPGTMKVVKDHLRELAKNTRSTHEELIGVATAVAAAGADTGAGIFNMTANIEKFAIGTGQTLETAADQVIKFANAFDWDLDRNTDEIWRFMNVVNLVGKRTAATAEDIMVAVTEFAPFAKMLEMSASDAVAFAAALPSLGLSADEAGTALKNMSIYAIENADKIAAAMAPVNDSYTDTQSVLDKLNTSAAQVFLDIAEAAQKTKDEGEDAASAIRTIMDIFEQRGGRGMAVLVNNTELLTTAMDTAKGEWEATLSLMADYERQMNTTQSQLAMFKNNINDAGITIGEVLLPVLNDIIQVAVPAIRWLAEEFKKLGKAGQMKIVALVGAVLLLGPAMMVFGQIIHFISMMNMGIGMAVKAVGTLMGGFLNIGSVALGVGKFFLGWPGLILVAITAILKILSTMGVDVSGFFRRLGASAKTWGENLARNLGTGLLAGAVRYVAAAITKIANFIAGFFESHSPPDEGPLSTIDRWGIGLMETFMKGFRQADFGMLSEVGGIIERELTRGVEDVDMPGALNAVKQAREIFAQMMTKFNATGILDEGMLNSMTSGLGALGDNVKDLIQKWVRYRDLQQQVQDLEKKRKDVVKGYEDEIAAIGASNMTAEEKVDAIRKAQRGRDDSLRGIEKEKKVLEEEVDLAQQQYEYQQAMISALQDQGDLFARIADALERLAGGGMKEEMTFSWPQPPDPDEDGEGEDPFAAYQEVADRFAEGQAKFQGLLDGFNQLEPLTPEDFGTQAAYDAYMQMYNLGLEAGNVKTKFEDFGTGVSTTWDNILKLFEKKPEGEGGGFLDGLSTKFSTTFGNISTTIGNLMKNNPWLKALMDWFDNLKTRLGETKGAWSLAWGSIQGMLANFKLLWDSFVLALQNPVIVSAMLAIQGVFATVGQIINGIIWGLISGILTGGSYLLAGIVTVISSVISILTTIVTVVTNIIFAIFNLFTGNFEGAKQNLITIGQTLLAGIMAIVLGVMGFVTGLFGGIIGLLGGFVSGFIAYIRGFVNGVIGFFKTLYDTLVGHSIVPDLIARIKSIFTGGFLALVGIVREKLASVVSAITGKATEIYNAGAGLIDGLKEGAKSAWQSFLNWFDGIIKLLPKSVKKILGIASPSKVFEQIGQNTILGFMEGISGMEASLGATMSATISPTVLAPDNLSMATMGVVPDAGMNQQIVLNFNKDSVRSDDDIVRIAKEVERILNKSAQRQLAFGSR